MTSVLALGVALTTSTATAATTLPAPPAVSGAPDLGPDVYVFTPSTPQTQIQGTLDALAAQQLPNQFGTQRYSVLFEPGTYGSAQTRSTSRWATTPRSRAWGSSPATSSSTAPSTSTTSATRATASR